MSGEIILYQTPDGQTVIETRLEQDTVWLTQKQMAELFQTTKQNISLHIKNCFQEGEISADATVKDFLTVQTEGKRKVERLVEHYNLDVIISVGYRVKSLRGTQFRIWANQVLKEHLVQGYTINQKLLREERAKLAALQASIRLLERSIEDNQESAPDSQSLIKLLSAYSSGLGILDDYDHDRLEQTGKTDSPVIEISPDEFLSIIKNMRREYDSEIFWR
jgi:hypothetical protein